MKVSAVIPAHNSENTIIKTIESLLRQDLKIDEIIVVDDGSNDKTTQMVSKYPVELIKQQNKGEAAALNTGLKKTKSDYLAIVESDVILPSNWLSALSLEFNDPQTYGVGAVLEVANSENFWAKISGYELEYRYRKIKSKFVQHITSANTLYKKKVFEEFGYYNESLVNACLDADLNGKIIEKGYKLVLRKDIKVKHFWKTNLFSYIKRHYAYAFCRPFLGGISLYPTDKVLIIQIFLTGLFLILFLLGFSQKVFFIWSLLIFFSLLLIQAPTIITMFWIKKDLDVLWFPLIFFLRNIVVLVGISFGIINKSFHFVL